MANRVLTKDVVIHVHAWSPGFDPSEQKCSCGSVLISREEQETRKQKWNEYFNKVRETHAYERFNQQMIDYNLGEMTFVKGCALQAKKDLNDNVPLTLEKPHFPDPSTWTKYVFPEVKSPQVKQAEKLFGAEAV